MAVPFPFVSGAVLTAAQLNAITSLPTTAKTASATLTAAESVGYRVTMTSASATTITINTGVYAAGDTVFITNLGAGPCTITAGTATVSSSGSLALPQYGSGVLVMTATGTGIWYPSANATVIGTSLPTAPYDTQQYILVDSVSAPTYRWAFQYNASSASTYKWEFIGGSAALTEVATYETTSSSTFTALTTAGPSFALPRNGDYQIGIGTQFQNTSTSNTQMAMSFDIGATGAVLADGIDFQFVALAANQIATGARLHRKSGLTASTLTAKYLAQNGGGFQQRWMSVVPDRVS